jgi:DedD protein
VAELQKRRYSAFILEYRASGQVLYRVRVGPEQDRARAEEIAARLAKDGFQPVVARHP